MSSLCLLDREAAPVKGSLREARPGTLIPEGVRPAGRQAGPANVRRHPALSGERARSPGRRHGSGHPSHERHPDTRRLPRPVDEARRTLAATGDGPVLRGAGEADQGRDRHGETVQADRSSARPDVRRSHGGRHVGGHHQDASQHPVLVAPSTATDGFCISAVRRRWLRISTPW
jgi:hypothetical protein